MDQQKYEIMKDWSVQSPEEPGFHCVLCPEKNACQEIWMYRLNLPAGEGFSLSSGDKELHAVLIQGSSAVDIPTLDGARLKKFDAFYLPAGSSARLTADGADCIFYIAGARSDGFGKPFIRVFDPNTPIGKVHQIHGNGAGQREVMFTLAPQDEASRLICGLTWGGNGAWTSWPPHQHEKDLEEVYCYFDMPSPELGFHVSYLESGDTDNMLFHPVHSGTMVQAPRGYHPTVSTPGCRNAYLWVLGARRHDSRSYELAVLDPVFDK